MDELVNDLADKLALSGFILNTVVRYKFSKGWSNGKTLILEEALPGWALERVRKKNLERSNFSSEEKNQFATDYQSYVTKHAIEEVSNANGKYAIYRENTQPNNLFNNLKCYFEDDALKDSQKIFSALEIIGQYNAHPQSSKLFDKDRLVLYWPDGLTKEQENDIKRVFSEAGIKYRGFAQDPQVVEVQDAETYEVNHINSNDGSLGEGGHNPYIWKGEKYELSEFFKQYIKLVSWAAKDPIQPYRQGYVPITLNKVNSEDVDREKLEKLKKYIESKSGLSALILENSSRLFLANYL